MFNYVKTHNFEERKSESDKIIAKYPDKIPVIVERSGGCSNVSEIDKNKFLVPGDLTVGQFVFIIRKRIKLNQEQALFIFINNQLPPNSSLISSIYRAHKSDCGFLFIHYSGESTFGHDDE
jgi:GABA(A) receptor-associated protein